MNKKNAKPNIEIKRERYYLRTVCVIRCLIVAIRQTFFEIEVRKPWWRKRWSINNGGSSSLFASDFFPFWVNYDFLTLLLRGVRFIGLEFKGRG